MSKGEYLGEFEQLVLIAILRIGRDAYAVPIAKEILECAGRSVSLGAIYATLERLEAKNLVASRLGESTPERGGRVKRHVDVTASGRRALRESHRMMSAMLAGVRLSGGAR